MAVDFATLGLRIDTKEFSAGMKNVRKQTENAVRANTASLKLLEKGFDGSVREAQRLSQQLIQLRNSKGFAKGGLDQFRALEKRIRESSNALKRFEIQQRAVAAEVKRAAGQAQSSERARVRSIQRISDAQTRSANQQQIAQSLIQKGIVKTITVANQYAAKLAELRSLNAGSTQENIWVKQQLAIDKATGALVRNEQAAKRRAQLTAAFKAQSQAADKARATRIDSITAKQQVSARQQQVAQQLITRGIVETEAAAKRYAIVLVELQDSGRGVKERSEWLKTQKAIDATTEAVNRKTAADQANSVAVTTFNNQLRAAEATRITRIEAINSAQRISAEQQRVAQQLVVEGLVLTNAAAQKYASTLVELRTLGATDDQISSWLRQEQAIEATNRSLKEQTLETKLLNDMADKRAADALANERAIKSVEDARNARARSYAVTLAEIDRAQKLSSRTQRLGQLLVTKGIARTQKQAEAYARTLLRMKSAGATKAQRRRWLLQEIAIRRTTEAITRAELALRKETAAQERARAAANRHTTAIHNQRGAFSRLERGVTRARTGLFSLLSIFTIFGLDRFFKNLVQVDAQLQTVARTLNTVTGNSQTTAQAMARMLEISDMLGVSFIELSGSYAKFASASRGQLDLGEIDKIFLATSKAVRALNLDSLSVKRAFKALEQIAGKGVVAMEELRGQLAESIPGAVQIMARELDLSVGAMIKLIEQGALPAKRALVALAEGFEKDFAEAAVISSQTVVAEIARIQTALTLLNAAILQGGAGNTLLLSLQNLTDLLRDPQIISGLVNIATALVNMLGWMIKNAEVIAKFAALMASLLAAKLMFKMAAGIIQIARALRVFTIGFTLARLATIGFLAPVIALLGPVGLIIAAVAAVAAGIYVWIKATGLFGDAIAKTTDELLGLDSAIGQIVSQTPTLDLFLKKSAESMKTVEDNLKSTRGEIAALSTLPDVFAMLEGRGANISDIGTFSDVTDLAVDFAKTTEALNALDAGIQAVAFNIDFLAKTFNSSQRRIALYQSQLVSLNEVEQSGGLTLATSLLSRKQLISEIEKEIAISKTANSKITAGYLELAVAVEKNTEKGREFRATLRDNILAMFALRKAEESILKPAKDQQAVRVALEKQPALFEANVKILGILDKTAQTTSTQIRKLVSDLAKLIESNISDEDIEKFVKWREKTDAQALSIKRLTEGLILMQTLKKDVAKQAKIGTLLPLPEVKDLKFAERVAKLMIDGGFGQQEALDAVTSLNALEKANRQVETRIQSRLKAQDAIRKATLESILLGRQFKDSQGINTKEQAGAIAQAIIEGRSLEQAKERVQQLERINALRDQEADRLNILMELQNRMREEAITNLVLQDPNFVGGVGEAQAVGEDILAGISVNDAIAANEQLRLMNINMDILAQKGIDMGEITEAWVIQWSDFRDMTVQIGDLLLNTITTAMDAIGDSIADVAFGAKSVNEAFKDLARTIVREVIVALVRIIAQQIVTNTIGQSLAASAATASAVTAVTLATAWAPAATLASIATQGGAAVVGAAAVSAALAAITGLTVGASAASAGTVGLQSGATTGGGNLFGNTQASGFAKAQHGREALSNDAFLVGEGGRELFVPQTNGRILSAPDTRNALSGGSGGPRKLTIINNGAPLEVERVITTEDEERIVLKAVERSRDATRGDFRNSLSSGYGSFAESIESIYSLPRTS